MKSIQFDLKGCVYFQCIITASVNHFNLQSQTSKKLHFFKVVFVLLLLFFIHITEEDNLLLLQSEGCAVLLLLLDQSDGRQIPVWVLLLTVVQRLWPLRSYTRVNSNVLAFWMAPEWLPRVGMSLLIFSSLVLCASPGEHWPVVGIIGTNWQPNRKESK